MSRKFASVDRMLVCVVVAWSALGGRVVAQEAAVAPAPEQVAVAAIEAYLAEAGDWGFAAAVWADGDIAWSDTWGMLDRERELPVTDNTMFRIGSVSKVITAMVVGAMAEDGVIALDAPVTTYVPNLPDAYAPVTIGMLAGHLSGVRHYNSQAEYLSDVQYETHTDALSIFINDDLVHPPGEAYLYTTFGYTLLGAALEHAAKEPYVDLVRRHVFQPAGMSDTFVEFCEPVEGELAVPYATMGGQTLICPPVNNSNKAAGGAIVSTAIDLARFLGAVAEDRLVSRATLNRMLTRQRTADGEATQVGIGWRIARDSNGKRIIHHGGKAAGGRAFVMLYPDHNVGVALCMNLAGDESSHGLDLAHQVAMPFLPDAAP